MKKVLHYVGKMDIGGIETLLMTIYRNIDRSEVQFDFAVHTTQKHMFDDEILSLGGKFYRFPMMRKNPRRYKKAWDDFWREHKDEYAAFHFHSPTFANNIALKSAKRHGVPVIIAHCHNTHAARGKLQLVHDVIHKYHRAHILRYATHCFACSEPAALWGFGEQYAKGKLPVTITKNGIDLKRFSFNAAERERVRRELSIDDKFVVGNVARLAAQKNQSFLLDIFAELKKLKNNAVLMLVGDGPDMDMLKKKARMLEIDQDILWLGAQENIPPFLCAMDCFVFPSVHEGLGISPVEAQAIGLPTYTSEGKVPEEVKMTDYLQFLPLEAGPRAWAEAIAENPMPIGQNTYDAITAAGYNTQTTVEAYTRFIKNGGKYNI